MEGIFRISGGANKITEIKKKFDKSKNYNLSPNEDIHVVSGVLKMYLRDLEDPIMTFALYDSLIEAMRLSFQNLFFFSPFFLIFFKRVAK